MDLLPRKWPFQGRVHLEEVASSLRARQLPRLLWSTRAVALRVHFLEWLRYRPTSCSRSLNIQHLFKCPARRLLLICSPRSRLVEQRRLFQFNRWIILVFLSALRAASIFSPRFFSLFVIDGAVWSFLTWLQIFFQVLRNCETLGSYIVCNYDVLSHSSDVVYLKSLEQVMLIFHCPPSVDILIPGNSLSCYFYHYFSEFALFGFSVEQRNWEPEFDQSTGCITSSGSFTRSFSQWVVEWQPHQPWIAEKPHLGLVAGTNSFYTHSLACY